MEIPNAFAITNDVWMVPCRIAPNKRLFKPINRPLDQFKELDVKKTRNTWSEVEDNLLKEIISSKGERSWACIAKEINIKLYKSFSVRSGKQCRERWFNQLNPLLNKSQFTQEEDDLLISYQKVLGNKWSQISSLFPGRTENQMKNRWKILKKKIFGLHVKAENAEIGHQIMNKEYNNEKVCELSAEGSPYSLDDIDNSFSSKLKDKELPSQHLLSIGDISPVVFEDKKENFQFSSFMNYMKVEGIEEIARNNFNVCENEDLASENDESFIWDEKNEVFKV